MGRLRLTWGLEALAARGRGTAELVGLTTACLGPEPAHLASPSGTSSYWPHPQKYVGGQQCTGPGGGVSSVPVQRGGIAV